MNEGLAQRYPFDFLLEPVQVAPLALAQAVRASLHPVTSASQSPARSIASSSLVFLHLLSVFSQGAIILGHPGSLGQLCRA